ncbi:hypothetical protein H6F75_11485 [Nodosilinea sp. FACHB-131]|jgi:hypothetical protein|nr:hypothetical protein [Nodosilinea sp. FACHB-131]MBD1874110.1 hypothetical protein [Nodosilinea sp. FACHB-131]MBW4460074.1 hypothetical protein [Nodosilinea sp. WJT8-NPBG4]
MTQDRNNQGFGATLDQDARPTVEFDQWARAVRQQMVAALKRRGNS